MFEELHKPIPDTDKVLERIGLAGFRPHPDIESLNMLILAFKTHIPFENLTVWYEGKTPSLAPVDLYNKIILNRRGGYCHEMNGLFCSFLKALGFNVYSVSGFVRENITGRTPLGHRSNICTLGGNKYFIEVGYGGSAPDIAVPLNGESAGDFFIFEENNEFTLYKKTDEIKDEANGNGSFVEYKQIPVPAENTSDTMVMTVPCKKIISFRDIAAYPEEFILPNIAESLDHTQKFRRNLVVNLKDEGGNVYSVFNDQFTIRTADGKETRKINDLKELSEILDRYFNIEISL